MENYRTYNTIGTISDHYHVPVGSLSNLITLTSTVTYIIIPTCVQGLFMQPTFVHTTELEVKGEATLSCRGNILLHVIFVFTVLFFRDSLVLCVFSLEFSIFLQKLNTAPPRRVPEFVNNVVDSRPSRFLLGLRRSSSPKVRRFLP